MTGFLWISFQGPVLGNMILCDSSTTVLSSSINRQEISEEEIPFLPGNHKLIATCHKENVNFLLF